MDPLTPDTLRTGEIFGSFRIARELGRGGMGVVYEAESLEDGRVVALKLLLAGMDADDARQRFLREGRVASTLMHPNTVYVFGTQEIDGMPTIAMEYVAGGTLEDVVSATGPVAPADAIRMVGQVIDGLEAAYAGGILHRDIKPSNCFVAQDGSIKVGDFGLSRPSQGGEDMRVTKTGMILGTPAYAPPEQLLGEPLDARSDIYSVGATLYYLLTGVLPFPGANPMVVLASVLQGTPAPPETHQPAIPKALSAIVLRAMARQPSDRFASYAEFRAALDGLSGVEVVPGRPLERVLAFLIDLALASPLVEAVNRESWDVDEHVGWRLLIIWGVFLCVRAIPEAIWGTSPGKRLFSLRTQRIDGSRPPWLVCIGRSSLTFLSASLFGTLLKIIPAFAGISSKVGSTLDTLLPLLLLSTVRQSNGYTAIHDRLFGTRVVKTRARQNTRRFARGAARTGELPSAGERIGAFILGVPVFTARDGSTVHDAIDATLGRPVWLHRVDGTAPARTMARRNLARPARMRWVAGRRDEAQSFDAYGTPDGQRMIDLPAAVSWEVCRGWLADLADEMVAAQRDGETLRPAIDDIWVSEGQQIIVMDFTTVPTGQTPDTPHAGAIVYAVAKRALCGAAVGVSTPWPALPRSVRTWLDTLPQLTDPVAVLASMALVRNTTAQVTKAQRLRVAAVMGLLPAIVVITILATVVPKLYSRPAIQASLEPLISFVTPKNRRLVTKDFDTAPKRTSFNFGVSAGKATMEFEQSLMDMSRDSSQRAAQIAAVDARRDTVARYLATTHGALLRDRTRRQRIVGDSLRWGALDSMFAKIGAVSASDSVRARQLVEQEWHGTLPDRDNRFVQVIANCVTAMHVVLGIEGFFVVLLAVSFRRGPVMRSVGCDVVDRSGRPASRLRLLARAAATWAVLLPLPFLVIEVVMYGIVTARSATGIVSYPFVWFGLVASGISVMCGGLVMWYGLRHPSRGIGDRIARTTTVPE